MENHHPKRVEDYTGATLLLLLVNLLWIFGFLWSQLGIGAVLVLAAILNHMITRLGITRARREAAMARFDRPAAHQQGIVRRD